MDRQMTHCGITALCVRVKILEHVGQLGRNTITVYRVKGSTEVDAMDDVTSSIDDGHVVAMTSLDISAAFDSVIHDVLVQRLEEEFGVTALNAVSGSVDSTASHRAIIHCMCWSVQIFTDSDDDWARSYTRLVCRTNQSADCQLRGRASSVR